MKLDFYKNNIGKHNEFSDNIVMLKIQVLNITFFHFSSYLFGSGFVKFSCFFIVDSFQSIASVIEDLIRNCDLKVNNNKNENSKHKTKQGLRSSLTPNVLQMELPENPHNLEALPNNCALYSID